MAIQTDATCFVMCPLTDSLKCIAGEVEHSRDGFKDESRHSLREPFPESHHSVLACSGQRVQEYARHARIERGAQRRDAHAQAVHRVLGRMAAAGGLRRRELIIAGRGGHGLGGGVRDGRRRTEQPAQSALDQATTALRQTGTERLRGDHQALRGLGEEVQRARAQIVRKTHRLTQEETKHRGHSVSINPCAPSWLLSSPRTTYIAEELHASKDLKSHKGTARSVSKSGSQDASSPQTRT